MTCEEDFQTCGSVTFGVLGYYYLQNDYKELVDGVFYDANGYVSPDLLSTPEYRLTPSVVYTNGGFEFSALGNYFPSMKWIYLNDVTSGDFSSFESAPKVRDYFKIDLVASYEFGLGKKQEEVPSKNAKKLKNPISQMLTKPWYNGIKIAVGANNVNNSNRRIMPNQNGIPGSVNYDYSTYIFFKGTTTSTQRNHSDQAEI